MTFHSRRSRLSAFLIVLGLLPWAGCQTHPGPPADADFQRAVVDQAGPVLVKFGAEWCGPCRALDPQLDRLESDWRGRLTVIRIDIDEQPELASHYSVSSIPRMLLFRDGEVVGDRLGMMDSEALSAWVEPHLR
jgi:thioredoxin 1